MVFNVVEFNKLHQEFTQEFCLEGDGGGGGSGENYVYVRSASSKNELEIEYHYHKFNHCPNIIKNHF